MTEPQITPAGEDQPMSEADRPPWSGEVAALAQEIATTAGRLAEADETLSRCAGGFRRLDGQVAELAQLLADLSQDQEGQLDENERLDRHLDALGQDVQAQRQAVAELENHLDDLTTQQLDENERLDRRLDALGQDVQAQRQAAAELGTRLDDLTTLAGELAERQAAQTRGERAIWWPDVPAGPERTAALRLLRAWVDEVLRGHHPELAQDSLQACWYRHDDVLDELTALRAAWHAAYRGKAAPATAAIEWHDRWLPGCMARCKTAIKARPCDMDGHHQSPPGTGASYDSVAFGDGVERRIVATRRTERLFDLYKIYVIAGRPGSAEASYLGPRRPVDALLEKYAQDILDTEPPSASASDDEFRAWRANVRERATTLIGEVRGDDEPDRKQMARQLAGLPDRERVWGRDAGIKAGGRKRPRMTPAPGGR